MSRFSEFNKVFEIISKFEGATKIIEDHDSLYQKILMEYRSQIYCSKNCHQRSKYFDSTYLVESKRIGSLMPIDNIYVICSSCDKKIYSKDQLFIGKSYKKSDMERVYDNLYKNEKSLSFPLESVFSKYFLLFLIVRLILRFQSKGMLHSMDAHDQLAVDWVKIVFPSIKHFIEKGEKFYRVQQNIYGDILNKNSIRLTDIEYSGGGKRFNRTGNWYLYVARDIDTSIKEARVISKEYFYSEFTVKKQFSFVDVRHINQSVTPAILNNAYSGFSTTHGGNYQTHIIYDSAISTLNQFFHPNISQKVEDKKAFKVVYNISQALSDIVIDSEINSIVYSSTQNKGGVCLCFFESDKIDEHFSQGEIVKV